MPPSISSPKNISKAGITVSSSTVFQDNNTPVSPIIPSSPSNASILVPPKGPDGRNLVLNVAGNGWRPVSTQPTYSDDQINSVTNNGTETSDVLTRGLEVVINESFPDTAGGTGNSGLDGGVPASNSPVGNLNAAIASSSSVTVPGVFTGDGKLIGQQLWKYRVTLFNHKQEPYVVPANAIKVLCVEDDLLSWPLRGYIIVDSRMEAFERSEDFKSFYYLRGDARDELKLSWYPEIEKGSLPDEIWKIDLEAVIYDVEDLPHSDLTFKSKKLYFWDKKFQNLLEKNIQWSTATGKRFISPECPEPKAHAKDEDRAMFTGEAIASLLSEAGYESFIDFGNWNWGKGKINFVAKASWSIWECILYILEQQVSDDGKYDVCILDWNRGDKKWNLSPVWKFFELAGIGSPLDLQIEHMFFEEPVGMEKTSISPTKAPLDLGSSKTKDIKSDNYNRITNYRFSQTSGLDNSKAFLSRPVYSHWHRKKQFDIDAKENEIKYVKDNYFKKNYVEYVLSPAKYPVMTMNKTKTEQKSIEPVFSPISTIKGENDRYIRSLDGRGKILYAGLFLNQSMVIRMIGSTHRLTGTFIGVDRLKTPSDTIYDYQVCGQYFVTNVKHIIYQQKYVNDITMVKVHAYESLPVNEGIE